jgi:hypothetical protein
MINNSALQRKIDNTVANNKEKKKNSLSSSIKANRKEAVAQNENNLNGMTE